MDINLMREIVTVTSFVVFVAIMAWAVAKGNRRRFDEAARLPFQEDGFDEIRRGMPQ